MKMDDLDLLAPQMAAGASPEVFQQLGLITRQLHDTLNQLGVMPRLQEAANGLPDARSRLSYIAKKTGDAANKVLNSVDMAKEEHHSISSETRRIAEAIIKDPVKAVATGAVLNFVGDVEAATDRIDRHLTDIMMAQDFQDLTGQVIKKVTELAHDLEQQLVQLLVDYSPAEARRDAGAGAHSVPNSNSSSGSGLLNGPQINPSACPDVVADQSQVDDLLESLGF